MPDTKHQRRKDARPDEIISAALAEFGDKGFASTSMGSIAARAGIARPTVYLYYPTKDAIFEAAVTDRMGGMVSRAQDILAVDARFDLMLEQVLRSYYDRIVGTDASALIRVLIAEGGRFPALTSFFRTTMLGTMEGLLSALVAKGIAQGELRAAVQDMDLKVIIAPAVFTLVFGLIFGPMDDTAKERFIRSHLSIILNGLRA
ncbi:TetR/AcrR family transcriptional regulator [Pseudorhodobacter ferrugineus]|uniref:TetR/AcrR family transcriptional regulator n=1 Tax=Pseudorhodobacter ferrugineus TaxID=77008 RepID=UPI0003B2FFDF|nr:TetR/AcrR family transcriptional regulator [Pseudorhodobacter ferrugineus]